MHCLFYIVIIAAIIIIATIDTIVNIVSINKITPSHKPMNNHILLIETIKKQLNFEPTRQQKELIDLLALFCCMPTETKAFILKGFAGTGKTSIVSGLIMAMKVLGQSTILLAPTGRAAKVLSNYSNHSAYSIHKIIYRQKSAGDF